jgi:phosphocarrier protein HPr
MRPAVNFVKMARQFRCKVQVFHGDKIANGLSPFDLISLLAMPGTELTLEIDGDEAETAFNALAAILTATEHADTTPPNL